MFNVIISKIAEFIIAKILQTTTYMQIAYSCLHPTQYIVDELNLFRSSITNRLSYNAQVCSIERLLNDRFDADNREIYITDAQNVDALVAYEYQDENSRIIVSDLSDFDEYEVVITSMDEIGNNNNKFTINIGDSNYIRSHENELIALVKRYKVAGKGFNIRYY